MEIRSELFFLLHSFTMSRPNMVLLLPVMLYLEIHPRLVKYSSLHDMGA